MRNMIIGGFVLLAACGSESAPQNVSDDAGAANETLAQTNDVTTNAGPALVEPPPGNNASEAASDIIPAAVQGRWGLVPADCTSTRGDAKGLLIISDTELRFYESRGTLRDVIESDASRIVADFDFMGEGQTWQRRMALDAQDDTLIRRESGADAMPGALRYTKCEA